MPLNCDYQSTSGDEKVENEPVCPILCLRNSSMKLLFTVFWLLDIMNILVNVSSDPNCPLDLFFCVLKHMKMKFKVPFPVHL